MPLFIQIASNATVNLNDIRYAYISEDDTSGLDIPDGTLCLVSTVQIHQVEADYRTAVLAAIGGIS